LGLLAIGLGLFTLGIIKGQDWGWDSEKTITSFLIAIPHLIAFVVREMTYDHPLLTSVCLELETSLQGSLLSSS